MGWVERALPAVSAIDAGVAPPRSSPALDRPGVLNLRRSDDCEYLRPTVSWGTPAPVYVRPPRLRVVSLVQGYRALVALAVFTCFVMDPSDARGAVEPNVSSRDVRPPDDELSRGIELSYDAPDACGGRDEVLRRVNALLPAAKTVEGVVKAVVVVRQTEGGWRVNYDATREGAPSKRELVVADCAAVVEASALLLALTLDPLAGEREPPATSVVEAAPRETVEPPPSGAPKTSVQPSPAPQTVPAQPTSTRTRVAENEEQTNVAPRRSSVGDSWIGLGGEWVTGIAPSAGRGVRLDVGSTLAMVRFGVSGSYDWVEDRNLPRAPFATLQTQLYRLRSWAGPVFDLGEVRFGPFVALGLEHLRARVTGISNPAPGAMTWLTTAAGAYADLHLGRELAFRMQGAAVFSLERRTFTVRGIPGLVHQPDVVGIDAAASLVWVWGAR